MKDAYYSVEQIARMLGIHPKTIQRHIREGRLRATKIGKSWRVTGHDLSVFAEGSAHPSGQRPNEPRSRKPATASAVVDIDVEEREDAIRIMNTLTAAANGKPLELGPSSLRTQYLESEGTVRVMLWGPVGFLSRILDAVEMLEGPEAGR